MTLAVVTGGGKGIGRAIVARLCAEGHQVVAVGRDVRALDEVAAQHDAVTARVCDVADADEVARLFNDLGEVDILVNNAGVSASAPLHQTTLDDWERHLRVNATGAFLCTRAVIEQMRGRGRGRIVMVASTAGLAGGRYIAAYAASKHAMVGLMRVAAQECAGSGVTANAVCPAYVRSEMTERTIERIVRATGRSADEAHQVLTGPHGRLVEPEEVAAAVAYLCGPEAAAVNGQTIVLDAGAHQ